jgi:hypothetical protein
MKYLILIKLIEWGFKFKTPSFNIMLIGYRERERPAMSNKVIFIVENYSLHIDEI